MKFINERMLIFQVGCIITLIGTISTRGQMLFASNVNDFKNLAKQYVPDRLADHLVALVSENSYKQKRGYKPKEISNVEPYKTFEAKKPLRTMTRPDEVEYVYYGDSEPVGDKVYTVSYDHDVNHDSKASYYEYEYEETKPSLRVQTEKSKDNTQTEPYVFEIDPSHNSNKKPFQVNLDQLVEKVKEKLLGDITKDPDLIKNIIREVNFNAARSGVETTERSTYTDWYERDVALGRNTEFNKRSRYAKVTRTKNTPQVGVSPQNMFKGFDLNVNKNQKDSYEDYITPKKEDNIFYSEENSEKTTKVKYKVKKFSPVPGKKYLTTRNTPRAMVSAIEYDDDNDTVTEADSHKARTETLKNVDYEARVLLNPNFNPNIRPDLEDKKPRKVKLGTMIPTRETFKISSPNYYAKLPTVAQKYDFNEPIPEKDREEEVFKPIGPEPVMVNGKKVVYSTENAQHKGPSVNKGS